MSQKKIWITLPIVGNYCLRPMRDEKGGSKEMLSRIAVKQGYYNAGQFLHESKNTEADSGRIDDLRIPPDYYTADQAAYFHEGYALGLNIANIMNHPFGELKCNGGTPMLPMPGNDLP